MATVNVYAAMSMDPSATRYGTITVASTTQIQITGSGYVQNYYGNFTYSGSSVSGGTVSSTDYYEFGRKIYDLSGSYSAVTVANYVLGGDAAGLLAYLYAGSDRVNGSSASESVNTGNGNDQLFGNGGNDVLSGGAGLDTINGGSGNDSIDGGADIDVAVYAATRANSTISKTASGWSVSSSVDGSDVLSNVERLQFADKKIALDVSSSGNAGKAMEFIGAVAYSMINNAAAVGSVLAFFDQGTSMHDVCQAAITSGLIGNLAGTNSNLDLARLVYRNVAGTEASAETANALAAYLQGSGGGMSQADFLTAIAQLDLNQQHINLVGLQTTGVEYA